MPPLKSSELTKLARERLGPSLAEHGFKRTPKASPASWCRAEGDRWLLFWFQPSTSNDAYSAGYKFTVEFLLGSQPEIYGNGFRRRLPTLLTDEGRERLRGLENRAISKLPPPDMSVLGRLPPPTLEWALKGWKPRSTPYQAAEDVWLRQGDLEDVEALLDFILAELPGALRTFLALAEAKPTG